MSWKDDFTNKVVAKNKPFLTALKIYNQHDAPNRKRK